MPIDPTLSVAGAEWQIAPVETTAPAPDARGGFGAMLGDAVRSLGDTQAQAAEASRAFAAGEATDATAVVMAVERARLAMQLAGQLRTKGVEAMNDVFHTQV